MKKSAQAAGRRPRTAYAALPYRLQEGRLEIMLVTTRGSGRWIIPKGKPERGLAAPAVAAKEAFEEAGLSGAVGTDPVGTFRFRSLTRGADASCTVTVYPLLVERQADDWREKGQRDTRWCTPDEAASLVREPDLAALLRGFRPIDGHS